jgi:hypothetical protein
MRHNNKHFIALDAQIPYPRAADSSLSRFLPPSLWKLGNNGFQASRHNAKMHEGVRGMFVGAAVKLCRSNRAAPLHCGAKATRARGMLVDAAVPQQRGRTVKLKHSPKSSNNNNDNMTTTMLHATMAILPPRAASEHFKRFVRWSGMPQLPQVATPFVATPL